VKKGVRGGWSTSLGPWFWDSRKRLRTFMKPTCSMRWIMYVDGRMYAKLVLLATEMVLSMAQQFHLSLLTRLRIGTQFWVFAYALVVCFVLVCT